MLLANISVATKIESEFPKLAVLRRHPPPKENMIFSLSRTLEKLGFNVDFSSSGTIAESLKAYEEEAVTAEAKAKFQVQK